MRRPGDRRSRPAAHGRARRGGLSSSNRSVSNKGLSLDPSVKNFGGSGASAENAGGLRATALTKPAEQQQPCYHHHRPDRARGEKVRMLPANRVCVWCPGLVGPRGGQQSEPSCNTEKLLHSV